MSGHSTQVLHPSQPHLGGWWPPTTIKYQATTATLDKSWWDVGRRLARTMHVSSLIFACPLFRTWHKTWGMGRGKVSTWTLAVWDGMENSALSSLLLAFATVLMSLVWGEKVDVCYCRGGVSLLEERVCSIQAVCGQVMEGQSMKLRQGLLH